MNVDTRVEVRENPGPSGALADVGQDARFALRWLRRNLGFATVVVLTLGLGIGANTLMFSVVNAVLLRPLPFPEPDRLVSVWPEKPLSRGAFVQFRERSRSYEPLAAYSDVVGLGLVGQGSPERVDGAYVSAELFHVLGAGAAVGRGFLPGEDAPGSDRVLVLSHGFWQQRFGGDRGIIGRQVKLDGVSRTVVGVMPPDFQFPARGVHLWVPAVLDDSDPGEFWGGEPALHLMGRLRPGVSLEQADAEVSSVARQAAEAAPWPLPADWAEGAGVAPLRETLVGDVGAPLLLLMGAVALVLLIACVNVTNLLLARAAARGREIATRAALGATRTRLVRQMLVESALLSTAGALLGLGLAAVGLPLLMSALPAGMPRAGEIGIDLRVLAFTLGLALVAATLFGVLPALRASRPDLQTTINESSRGSGGIGHRRMSAALVAGEVALAVMLVVGAGLLLRSLSTLLEVETGFRAGSVLTARVSPPPTAYPDEERMRLFYRDVLERVEALPGVTTAAAVHRIPLGGEAGGLPIHVEGQPVTPGAAAPFAAEWRVTPDYLQTMGIPLVRGRAFQASDHQDAPHVALVNEAMARRFWPGEDPVGKRFRPVWWRDWVTVVGVVGNVKDQALTEEVQLEVYRPFAQGPLAEMNLVVRTASDDPEALAGSLRRAVWSVDPDVPVSGVRSMEEVVSASVARPRFTVLLLSLFAVLALVLGSVGIYGVIAFAVTHRVREIGIRMALGASPGDVLRRELLRGMGLAAVGVLAGVAAALLGARLIRGLLYQVSPTDPATFGGVALLVLTVALLASYVPARRATRVDPTSALRAE